LNHQKTGVQDDMIKQVIDSIFKVLKLQTSLNANLLPCQNFALVLNAVVQMGFSGISANPAIDMFQT